MAESDIGEPWPALNEKFQRLVSGRLGEWVAPGSPHYASTLEFAVGRLEEGRQLGSFFLGRNFPGRVLDIGAGNGGVSVGLANYRDFRVCALDLVPNNDLRDLRKQLNAPVEQVLGNGQKIPFGDAAFHVVLCLETIEHVPRPDLLASEMMRVLRPGGMCMITTPARFRYWFRRDPHYNIPALLLLPDKLQRFAATTLLRRTQNYDVEHIFWHVSEITRLFGDQATVEVLWNRTLPTESVWRDRLWFRFRNFMWDRIVITKR